MKSDVMPSRVQMDAAALRELLNQVNETVATDFEVEATEAKTFTAADLWRIQRNRKIANGYIGRRISY